ncbi:aspartic-type endopeptidase [Grosmannia clavigera kw1407]|uniref:Probable aspartic-type endopeptidase OPSB n=1 Tax=Grosmannia clavigera (strain kw1407 / UAMH 11150) TaxID=655863 RepID=F0XAH0_GROCL|nr:aspartic-type endopeptidase [Grosmannia clavigera kw1407]EFX06105.1 aspartic-type endopeptidase [Grosmannia clavigera kw1407]
MKGHSVAAGAVLAATVNAATPEGVVQWNIGKRQPHPRAIRRSVTNTDQITISNNVSSGGYFAECEVGTPAQTLTLQLDTGSSDTWLPASNASVCSTSRHSTSSGCSLGSFDSSSSSTFSIVNSDFSIQYVDGSESVGDYFTDVFVIGGSTISNLTMGLGLTTDISFGLVGVGYASNEAIVGTEDSFSAEYANLPVALVNSGIIKSRAYSLWLNDLDASTGNILFGGIDTEKYDGELTSIDIYKDSSSETFTSFIVALTSVNASSSSGTDLLTSREFPISVVLDSGTTLSYVPNDLAAQIWTEVGAVYSSDVGAAVIPCSKAGGDGVLSFGFAGPGGPVINVTMDELVLGIGSATFTSGEYKGETACEFGIQNMTGDPYMLGDTFLRSAYVVYDLVNNQIGIAPTKFNATATNIVAFTSSGAAIPSATTAPHQDQVTSATSYTTPGYAASSGFSSSDSSSSSSKNSGASSLVTRDALRVALTGTAMFLTGGLLML